MKEYRIVVQKGNCRPYSLWTFKTFDDCYIKLLELINLQSMNVKKEYYVINNFFDNQYVPFLNDITKYTIECREVTEWRKYEKEKRHNKSTNKVISLF